MIIKQEMLKVMLLVWQIIIKMNTQIVRDRHMIIKRIQIVQYELEDGPKIILIRIEKIDKHDLILIKLAYLMLLDLYRLRLQVEDGILQEQTKIREW